MILLVRNLLKEEEMFQENAISDEQGRKYREIDPFWGTQAVCDVCQRCLCETCHPNGPCVLPEPEITPAQST
jgi:hypothetical protein